MFRANCSAIWKHIWIKTEQEKNEQMWIGSSKTKNTKILEFRSTKVPIKILEAHLSDDVDKNNDANFLVKIRKMKTKLNLWQTRDLTLYGKSLLAKTILHLYCIND